MGSATYDAKATFVKNMQDIMKYLEEGQYVPCFHLSADLTRFSCLLGQKNWVFTCEVLESVYNNMTYMSNHLVLPKDDEAAIRTKLHQSMNKLLPAIENDDEAGVWQSLQQIRFDATVFQMRGLAAYPPKRGASK